VAPLIGEYQLGASIAAAVAAVEPFKAALTMLAETNRLNVPIPELLQPTTAALVTFSQSSEPASDIDIGDVDFVSGGALTNGALHALLRVKGLRGRLRILEPESLDLSNLNRYMLARQSDVGLRKADVLARYGTSKLKIEPVATKLDAETIASVLPMAPTIVVGADSVPSRWLAQRQWPEHLAVGATADFLTMTSSHRYPGPCAGCIHPLDDDVNVTIPTVSFVSYFAGISLAARVLRHAASPRDPIEDQVWITWPLRLDLVDSILRYPLRPDARCPVRCPASSGPIHTAEC
jgi:hypothetical protein